MNSSAASRDLPLRRVAAALVVIAVLAMAPFAAVRAFHNRRLERADRQLEAIASAVSATIHGSAGRAVGAKLLTGRGPLPIAGDELWTSVPGVPLAGVAVDPGPDPWGNAYLVNISDPAHAWAVSAGPDGILQTRFSSASTGPAGDDRSAAVR